MQEDIIRILSFFSVLFPICRSQDFAVHDERSHFDVLFTFNINCLKSFFPSFTFWSNLLILFFCARQTNNFLCVNWEAHRNENFFLKKKRDERLAVLKHIVMYILVFFLLSQHFHNRKRKSYAKDIMLCWCSVPTNFRFLGTEIV